MFLKKTIIALAAASAALLTGSAVLAQTTVNVESDTTVNATSGNQKTSIEVALATAALAKDGITNPTQVELDAAVAGILDQRSAGNGWGKIANDMGVNLGAAISASRNSHTQAGMKSERMEKLEKAEKSRKVDKTRVANTSARRIDVDSLSIGGKGSRGGNKGDHGNSGGNGGGNSGGNGGGNGK